MLTVFALVAALQTAPVAPAAAPDPILVRMVALYEDVCLKTFPDDRKVAAAMKAKGATAMSGDELSVYLRDDAGMGWFLPDDDARIAVTVEAPPYHACAVRRDLAAPFTDFSAYKVMIDRFKAGETFSTIPMVDRQVGETRVQGGADMRMMPDGTSQNLLVVLETSPGRINQRFVHQLVKR